MDDPDYYKNHMAHIRIIRRNRELLARINQQQPPAPPAPAPQDGQQLPAPLVPPPAVAPPLPPVAQQDIIQLPEALQAAQLQTPEVQDIQEEVPPNVLPPPPPRKTQQRFLPTPPEVKRTNLSDSLEDQEEAIIVPVIFQDTPVLVSPSAPVNTVPAEDKTSPSTSDGWFLPSAASTPGSGIITVHDSPDSFHSLSDQDSQTIVQTPDSTPSQSSSTLPQKKKSSSSAAKLFQEFQGAAQAVALTITKPPELPIPQAPTVVSPCPRHGRTIDFGVTSLEELNQRECTCPPELPPTRDPTDSLPPVPPEKPEESRPHTRQRGVPKGHYNPITQVFTKKKK